MGRFRLISCGIHGHPFAFLCSSETTLAQVFEFGSKNWVTNDFWHMSGIDAEIFEQKETEGLSADFAD